MFIRLAIVFLTLCGKSLYTKAHTTRPYPTKFPSNTSNAYKTSQTLGTAVASLTPVGYYTDKLTGYSFFSSTPRLYNTHDCTKTNHPPRVHYTTRHRSSATRINTKLRVFHVPTTLLPQIICCYIMSKHQ